jgi:membrane protease YdiL (CAAX protease family)
LDELHRNVGELSGGLTPSGAGDARVRALSLRARLEDVAQFMVRPTFVAQPMAWGRAAVLALLAVFALDIVLDTLAQALTAAWDESAGFLPAPVEYETTLAEDLIEFLILAPVLEELAFRGWLTGRIAALRFAVYGFAALALFMAALFVGPEYAGPIMVAGLAIVFAGLIHWSRTRHRDNAVPAWFAHHFRWFVWGSALVFGLIHLGNYEPLTHPLGVLVVLPQTIGGLLLAYTRTRLGLGAAMAHHAAYNALFLAGDYGWW